MGTPGPTRISTANAPKRKRKSIVQKGRTAKIPLFAFPEPPLPFICCLEPLCPFSFLGEQPHALVPAHAPLHTFTVYVHLEPHPQPSCVLVPGLWGPVLCSSGLRPLETLVCEQSASPRAVLTAGVLLLPSELRPAQPPGLREVRSSSGLRSRILSSLLGSYLLPCSTGRHGEPQGQGGRAPCVTERAPRPAGRLMMPTWPHVQPFLRRRASPSRPGSEDPRSAFSPPLLALVPGAVCGFLGPSVGPENLPEPSVLRLTSPFVFSGFLSALFPRQFALTGGSTSQISPLQSINGNTLLTNDSV